MVRQIEAVFEGGVLRPLEPLSLQENEHVRVTVADNTPEPELPAHVHRYAEQAWLAAHSGEYRDQWVALEGDALVSHGLDALAVHAEARSLGVENPLMVHIDPQWGEPSAGFFL